MVKQVPCYSSRGVAEQVPLNIQLILWRLVETVERENPVTDYLHVFECSTVSGQGGKCLQKVIRINFGQNK